MNVLSLFDGMSCGRIALERAGLPVTNYYASEIDKYAIKVSEANYPDITQLGDVTKVKIDKGRKIDLLIAGSPCQGFSFAGKQLNFEDPRSALFFEFVRILKECRRYNPDVLFMLENVKMKKEYQDVISGLLGVEPVEINSALVSAQNRKRLYWTNIPGVGQPEDREIILRSVLEEFVDIKYYPSKDFILKQAINPSETNGVITINPKKIDGSQTYQQDRVYGVDGKMVCLSAELSGRFRICENLTIRKKSKCVRSSGRSSFDRHEWDSIDNLHTRKLTPMECERLQNVPDNYTNHVSEINRYKMLGNGWNVNTIQHIFSYIKL